MSKFSDFVNQNNYSSKEDLNNNSGKKYSENDLQSMINKYKDMNQNSLMNEFLKLTIEKKQKGELSEKELLNIKNTIYHVLTDDQKIMLDKLIKVVKNI